MENYPYGRISCDAHVATHRTRNGVAIEPERKICRKIKALTSSTPLSLSAPHTNTKRSKYPPLLHHATVVTTTITTAAPPLSSSRERRESL